MIETLPKRFEFPPLFELIRNGMVIFLRKCFASNLIPQEYKYDIEETKTKIKIYNTYPMKLEFFPCIIVTIDNIDISTQYLQDEFDQENLEYFGKIEAEIKILIKTRTIKDRDRLVDILFYFFRILGKNFFRGLNIEFFKNIRVSDESIEIVNEMPVYTTMLSFPCYSEYSIKLPENEFENLLDFNVTVEEIKQTQEVL